jgi:hypothetical protein
MRSQSDKRQIDVGACWIRASAKRYRPCERGYQGFSYKQRRAFPLACKGRAHNTAGSASRISFNAFIVSSGPLLLLVLEINHV